MKNESFKFLQKSKKQLLDTWMTNQLEDQTLREDLMANDDLKKQSDELLTALLKTLSSDNLDNTESKDFEQVTDILSDISLTRARQGFSSRETALFVLSLKIALNQALEKEFAADSKLLYDAVTTINKLLDKLNIITFETFLKGREEVIIRQTDEMNEISTPVIRVWDGVVALPIIGTLDSMRTQVVMENLLQEIVATGSSIAILDISGVPAVDSLVAQHLLKTVSATRLMGAECIISGIRPEIAQTIVHLGIDLSHIKTKASLASALKLAFSMLNLEVKKVEKTRQAHG
jgi:rsbT co-antagonist protein RsbR